MIWKCNYCGSTNLHITDIVDGVEYYSCICGNTGETLSEIAELFEEEFE